MFRSLIAINLFIFSCIAQAANTAPPLLEVQGGELPIQLKKFSANAEIDGGYVETRIFMEFYNPNHRDLEGELQFPLRGNQQIKSFSLDIDGVMRAAVPIDKARASEVFEAVERRSVDPGLLEQIKGNNFKLRIYPIDALESRKVEIVYIESLQAVEQSFLYQLPLNYDVKAEEFSLTLAVKQSSQIPQVISGSFVNEFKFSKDKQGYIAHLEKENYQLQSNLSVAVPAKQSAFQFQQAFKGKNYFFYEQSLALPFVSAEAPTNITLLWDASGSGAERDHNAELRLLNAYFQKIKNVKIKLILLRNKSEPPESFIVQNGNWEVLEKKLHSIVYDGATCLGDWIPDDATSEYWLFSDGLENFRNVKFPQLNSKQRLQILSAASNTDDAFLDALAERNYGNFIRLDVDKIDISLNVLSQLSVSVTVVKALGVDELLVDHSKLENGYLSVAGVYLDDAPEIQLKIQKGEIVQNVTLSVTKNVPSSKVAAYQWAYLKLKQLSGDYDNHSAEIGRIGQNFSIPTRTTALIVLDSVDDYLRYNVEPPEDLRAEYIKAKADQFSDLEANRKDSFDNLIKDFEEKIHWWEENFPKGNLPKALRQSNKSRSHSGEEEVVVTGMRAGGDSDIQIQLKKWVPNAPYFARLKTAPKDKIYQIYLDEKPNYFNSSAFYLDVADLLIESGQQELGLRVLSNVAEMNLENRALLRILAYRLSQLKMNDLAITVFNKVKQLAPFEPQSYRDLGLAYAENHQYQEAIEALNWVIENYWDDRFGDIKLICVAELNAIVAKAAREKIKLDTAMVDSRLQKNLPLEVRVVLTWDANDTDMDLWVTDPNGEKCFYGHRDTYQGGRMSKDFTDGYGPEEFSLKKAKRGRYKIEANFYGNHQQVIAGATTLQLKLIRGFGTAKEREKAVTLRLSGESETIFVGEFIVN